jgi:hypothetical protein
MSKEEYYISVSYVGGLLGLSRFHNKNLFYVDQKSNRVAYRKKEKSTTQKKTLQPMAKFGKEGEDAVFSGDVCHELPPLYGGTSQLKQRSGRDSCSGVIVLEFDKFDVHISGVVDGLSLIHI